MHLLLLLFVYMLVLPASAQESNPKIGQELGSRVALVVGNGSYDDVAHRLPNPPNDAHAVAAKLRGLGFKVIEAVDLDYSGMRAALRQFDRALQKADAGLFFYAGHAMEFQGRNYLFPTDAVLETEGDIGLGLIDVSQVLTVMETTVPTRLVFLDSCRDNPLARQFSRSLGASRTSSVGKGLARIDAAIGTFIAYATAPGEVAVDGDGANSPFTLAMLEHLDEPGLDIDQFMRKVRNSVLDATDENQIPWNSSSLRGPFILNLDVSIEMPPAVSSARFTDTNLQAEILFWDSIKDSDHASSFKAYMERFGSGGTYASLAKLRIDALSNEDNLETAPVDQHRHKASESDPLSMEVAIGLRPFYRKAVQEALNTLGFDPRGIDGVFGTNTRHAIARWQESREIEPTGYLTPKQHGQLLAEAEQRLAGFEVPNSPSAQTSQVQQVVGSFKETANPSTSFKDCLQCPEMVVVPAGSFFMGSHESEPGSQPNERPLHKVNLRSFAIGKYEVTFAEWDACVAAGGCNYKPNDLGWGRGYQPVVLVSWLDAQRYADWLSRETGEMYRLPSEAEWEFAARAFPTSRGSNPPAYAFGDSITKEQANFGNHVGKPIEVGSYQANDWGIHDMQGNVWEWVEDALHDSYRGAPTDGRSWIVDGRSGRSWYNPISWFGDKSQHVLRGSSWNDDSRKLRTAVRIGRKLGLRNKYIGFRVARAMVP